jgi:hypothetical protein
MGRLVELAREHFGKKNIELWPSEIKLLDGVEEGIEVNYRVGDTEKDNPANAKDWGQERIIRADIINWLCTNIESLKFIPFDGIHITGARINENINLMFINIDFPIGFVGCYFDKGIDLSYSKIDSITLAGSHISGSLDLLSSKIDGSLICAGCHFVYPVIDDTKEPVVFLGDGLTVTGSIFINEKAKFEGETRLVGAYIRGQLNCESSLFINNSSTNIPNYERGAIAFNADGIIVKGEIFFHKAEFKGIVRLLGADIGGQLNCINSKFINSSSESISNAIAFGGDSLKAKGSVILENANTSGEARFLGANIGGQLRCTGGIFSNKKGSAIILQGATINDVFYFGHIENIQGAIDLIDASIKTLEDDNKYWDQGHTFILDGFAYNRIHCDNPKLLTAEERLKWLACQPKDHFHPQPYDQLAKVFRNMGQEQDARDVLFEKYRLRRKQGGLNRYLQAWNWLLEITTGYGYKMRRAFLVSLIPIVIGLCIFGVTDCYDDMGFSGTAQQKTEMKFCPLIYSIDTFLPVVDLHQEKYWSPNVKAKGCLGDIAYGYLNLHILAGWILTTLVIASITGLVRRE